MEQEQQQIREDAKRLEKQSEEMDERTDELQDHVDEAREDFEAKQRADDVPGAQPPGGHQEGEEPPQEASITPGD